MYCDLPFRRVLRRTLNDQHYAMTFNCGRSWQWLRLIFVVPGYHDLFAAPLTIGAIVSCNVQLGHAKMLVKRQRRLSLVETNVLGFGLSDSDYSLTASRPTIFPLQALKEICLLLEQGHWYYNLTPSFTKTPMRCLRLTRSIAPGSLVLLRAYCVLRVG